MIATMNCATGTIAPYVPGEVRPWTTRQVQHLFRRAGFGATPEAVRAALQSSPEQVVDELIDNALALPPTAEPAWANWTENDYTDFNEQANEQRIATMIQWIKDMARNGLREKVALFWHNHFVTKIETYLCPSYQYQYLTILQEHALGNFRTFVMEIGKTPAMLIFLNGVQNTNIQPNENYARELFELFTLGRDNGYNQKDIEETARALTGWVGFQVLCAPIGYVDVFHDKGEKEIFGQKGNWNFDDVHDLLFEYRADEIAAYICTKLYTHFVHPEAEETIIAEMASTFKANNFEIAPVLRQLFKSEHFYDEYVIGTQIKSPVDLFLSFIRDAQFPTSDEVMEGITYFSFLLGQQVFSPPDVAGWPGNRTWINNNTISTRWQALTFFIFSLFENQPQLLVDVAKELSEDAIDPAAVTQSIIDHFIPNGLYSPEAYEQATSVFKFEVPQNYFDEGLWSLDWEVAPAQVALLLRHLIQLPEFQLQ